MGHLLETFLSTLSSQIAKCDHVNSLGVLLCQTLGLSEDLCFPFPHQAYFRGGLTP